MLTAVRENFRMPRGPAEMTLQAERDGWIEVSQEKCASAASREGQRRDRALRPKNSKCKGPVVGRNVLEPLRKEESLKKTRGSRKKTAERMSLMENLEFHPESRRH